MRARYTDQQTGLKPIPMKTWLSFSLFALWSLLALPVPAAASAVTLSVMAQGAAVSESAAVAAAQRVVKGRVLSVQLIESRGPPVYRVKILTENGRVRTVHVDGQSGDVISY